MINNILKNLLAKPNRIIFVLNGLILIGLLVLPYYLFGGRLFLGGDDTRLQYIYPVNVLKNLALYSWVNISSLPSYLPNFHLIPILIVLAIVENFIKSKVFMFYFMFSLPYSMGFIYFQKFIKILINEKDPEVPLIASLVYIFAPITVVSQMSNFLFSAYLIAAFPLVAYYYASYLKNGQKKDIYAITIWSFFLSIAFFAIQWIAASLLPLCCGLFVLMIIDNPIKKILKRSVVFFYFLLSSQIFWIFPFVISLLYTGGNDLGNKLASTNFTNSFTETVQGTATDTIINPLLTFYHRQIAFDYLWQLRYVFTNYFDYVLPLSTIFVIILILGCIRYTQALPRNLRRIFIFFLVSFLAILYLSTVNIVLLKDIFLLFGHIPGFAIFRNFTDKFALGYIFIYAILIGLCLQVIKNAYKFYSLIIGVVVLAIFINFIPVKSIVVSPLWKTESIYTTVNVPKEYTAFAEKAKKVIPNDTNIIAFPQNLASYSIIAEADGKHVYVGTSPFKFFSTINDLSGSGSYPYTLSNTIQNLIINRNYSELLSLFSKLNIGYVMVTQNIPKEVLNSYLFDTNYLKFQDKQMLDSIVDHEVLRSSKGNYIIYILKNSPNIIIANSNIQYHMLSPILYEIKIQRLNQKQSLTFLESYHPGWKLYLAKNNSKMGNNYFSDLAFIFSKPVFDNTHKPIIPYGNQWTVDPNLIHSSGGSADVVLYLYFYPQSYFYIGVALTTIFLLIGFLLLNRKTYEK